MTTISRLKSYGFVRIAAISPELRVADVDFNTTAIISALENASTSECDLALFPELSLTGYSCGDLLYNSALLEAATNALADIAEATSTYSLCAVVGLPLAVAGKLYNCAAFCANGKVLGIIPKTFLPNRNEFYETRWFSSANDAAATSVYLGEPLYANVPFGNDILFSAENLPDCVFGVEICEDLWSVIPPSSSMALAGATVLLNTSASNELLGKAAYRRDLIKSQSARCLSAYCYSSAGAGESTTDLVFSGHCLIAENGGILRESERFSFSTTMCIADVDIERLRVERLKSSSFSQAKSSVSFRTISFSLPEFFTESANQTALHRPLSPTPFVPANPSERTNNCQEIFALQTTALAKRLVHTQARSAVLGLSGGLDSTLALLVIVQAYQKIGWNRKEILAITMPGFGTTTRTKSNAARLAEQLGVSLREISIEQAVRVHFADIGHDEQTHDITFENAQARERTQILMDMANQNGGIVVGTGDLSELALGWCTFNADQMAMYNVNAGVPKTLVRYLIDWYAETQCDHETAEILRDICDTPVSPELLPPNPDGTVRQITENVIGPYELHDYFLYFTVRFGFSPRKIFFLAKATFGEKYAPTEILHHLRGFFRRFISQQFKRSPMPDGPKVGSVGLSPRGDWRMPSDARAELWLKEIEKLG